MTLDLNPQQTEVLREILDNALRDLRYEIADTDNHRYKQDLKAREDIIRSLLDPLGGPLPNP